MDSGIGLIRLHRYAAPIDVLGPGLRAGIWVQGCTRRCRGCVTPDSWDPNAGVIMSVRDLASWVIAQQGIEGITLSGGEPMLQAGAIRHLIAEIRAETDLGVVCYTGYQYEWLTQLGSVQQRALLDAVDLLIDGPYMEDMHADLLWRGSSNQRLLSLSDRYGGIIERLDPQCDRSAGLQFFLTDEDNAPWYAGIPHQIGFRHLFEEQMRAKGIDLVFGKGGKDERES